MQRKQWMQTAACVMLVRALVLTAYAQDAVTPYAAAQTGKSSKSAVSRGRFGAGKGAAGFQNRLERAVGLTSEQRDAVRGLLAQQREELQSLREGMQPKFAAIRKQTDTKIRSLLNPEQQKKFDAFLENQKQARGARAPRAS